MSTETRNPYFEAVEAKTLAQADQYFARLLTEAIEEDPSLRPNEDHARERVVANLCYVAGYYDEGTRNRVGRLHSHRSPYRRDSNES